jgi:hypothetical protein
VVLMLQDRKGNQITLSCQQKNEKEKQMARNLTKTQKRIAEEAVSSLE